MKSNNLHVTLTWFLSVALIVSIVACGKKKEEEQAGDQTESLADIAKRAQGNLMPEDEAPSILKAVEDAGFIPGSYLKFPAEELGKKGRVLTYTDKKKKSGGILYIRIAGNAAAPAWHWYFDDMAPDSVLKVEVNEDGLWDMRVVSTKGKEQKFIQDDSFTLMGVDRFDWVAMNGESSPPVTAEDAMWKCFDGDTTTAWKSSLEASGGEAFLEFFTPFGVQDGILSLHTLPTSQPRGCTVIADGKKLQSLEFQAMASRQMVKLDGKVQGARKIRLVFDSTYGADNVVAVSEVALK